MSYGSDRIMEKTFRHSTGFGKRIEYWVIGLMLKEGIDVYVPLVDDNAIDAIIKKNNGTFIEIQIKARSKTVKMGSGALFAAIPHELRKNYFFVFYSERLDTFCIMSSEEFIKEAVKNKSGKNVGLRAIRFNGKCKDKTTGEYKEHIHERFKKYIAKNFSQFK